MNRDQISLAHRTRLACVYIRQSSPHQVVHHKESQGRQRSLVDRALELGWPRDLVVSIDDDLGESAARSNARGGFEQLVAQAALGKVGLILALDVSRLTRGNSAWYHLLDVCAITGTLIADTDGLYDPRQYNDRLLLGLKGTMSEAELHLMKQRLVEAMKAKAKRGEFQFQLPPGFVWDEAGRIQKVADEQVRGAIERVFERFARLGTIHQVHASLIDDAMPVLHHSRDGHRVRWSVPSYAYLYRMLRHPMYGGAYVYGQRQVEEVLDASQRPVKRVRKRARKDWPVLIQDHHEGYIAWEQFERNQRQIEANRNGTPGPGAPRAGGSLLQGQVLCGQCGRPMRVSYGRGASALRFTCAGARRQTGGPVCQSFGGLRLERAVERLVLDALEPLGVEGMIAAAGAHVQASDSERVHWHQRVERARYEVELARRQYDAVDPANRLVARELERRFETALDAVQAIEQEAAVHLRRLESPLSARDQERLRRYAQHLPALWHAPTTRPQDRKRIVRLLIEHVIVTAGGGPATLQADVHWSGGERSHLELAKGRPGLHRYVAPGELIDLLRTLAREFSDAQIARILNRKGIRTPKGLPFNAHRVGMTRHNHQIANGPIVPRMGDDIHTAEQAAAMLGVNRATVIRWVDSGLLKGAQLTPCAPWRIQLTPAAVRRLTATDAPEGWLSLKKAALALGVSQQTVVQRLKAGTLEGVRVRRGRRSGWRVRVKLTTYDQQPTLFGPASTPSI